MSCLLATKPYLERYAGKVSFTIYFFRDAMITCLNLSNGCLGLTSD